MFMAYYSNLLFDFFAGYDCGVYTCMYMDYISSDHDVSFSAEDVNKARRLLALILLNGKDMYMNLKPMSEHSRISTTSDSDSDSASSSSKDSINVINDPPPCNETVTKQPSITKTSSTTSALQDDNNESDSKNDVFTKLF
jgi:hypothetical protein